MARVKQTGKPKARSKTSQPNGAGSHSATKRAPRPTAGGKSTTKPQTSTATAGKTTKTTTQPTELSEADRAKLKTWLDQQVRPFNVATSPASGSRKRKRGTSGGGGGQQVQGDLFDARLQVLFEVQPADKWECLRRYKKFTVGSESIASGQCILVKHDDLEESQMDVAAQWKAKVLEVRALDSEHVYIRVAWLNRPEDLEGGRQPYHGRYELIPTNQMDVIDAMTVNGSLDVQKWNELDDDSPVMDVDEFFWRQTYDVVNAPGKFSNLRKICIEPSPQNPDELILQCGNSECRRWMHVKCIAEQAVQRAADDTAPSAKKAVPKKGRPKAVTIPPGSQAQAKAQTDAYTAEVLIKNLPQNDSVEAATKTEIILTEAASGEKQIEDVQCLFCGTRID